MTLINVLNVSEYLFLQKNKQNYEAILDMLQSEKGVRSLKIEIQEFGTATWDDYIQPAPIQFDIQDIKENIIPIIENQVKEIDKNINKLLVENESEDN